MERNGTLSDSTGSNRPMSLAFPASPASLASPAPAAAVRIPSRRRSPLRRRVACLLVVISMSVASLVSPGIQAQSHNRSALGSVSALLSPGILLAQSPSPIPADTLRQLDVLWDDKRHDPAVALQMKRDLEGMIKTYGERYELTWRMARQFWWLADGETDSARMEQLARQGWDWGKKAVKLNPEGVEGNFWISVCIGQYSLAIGILRALANGLESVFNQYLDKSIQLNKAYAGAGPLRTKGNYWQSLPWPKRDLAKAEATLKEAIKLAPQGMRSRLYLAETLEKKGDKDAAIAECDRIIKAQSSKVELGDYPRILARATALKQRLLEE